MTAKLKKELIQQKQGGAIQPKTRRTVEQAARTQAAPTSAPGPMGKKAAAKRITGRARKKVQREAQRGMLQKSKRAAQATAMCVIFLAAAVIASPFGILFANEPSPWAVPLNAAVNQINMELSDRLKVLQAEDYGVIDIRGAAPDWREAAAVFACKTTMGADSVDGKEAHITITSTELLDELDVIGGLLANRGISDEKVIDVLRRLPDDLSPERRAVVETACKLVRKVNCFWGGKSSAIG